MINVEKIAKIPGNNVNVKINKQINAAMITFFHQICFFVMKKEKKR